MKFTKANVADATSLPAGKRDHIYWADKPTGFGLRVRLGGDGKIHKSYVLQYRIAGRRTRRLALGKVGEISPEQAFDKADKERAKVVLGGDPQAERRKERRQCGDTLKEVVGLYLASKKREVRANTYRNLDRYLTGSYFKPLHGMPVEKVTRRDVAGRLTRISIESSPIVAAAARATLSARFAWAMGEGLAESNPVIGTNAPKTPEPRERVLDDAELAAVWHAAGDDQFGKIVKLLILLGQRRQEVGGMKITEIGADGIWRLPPERTKNDRAHELPLPQMALDIIATVPEVIGRDHLFGVRGLRGFRDWEQKADLDQRLGDAVAPWKLHDVRRTVATGMGKLGVLPHVVECVLNHQSGFRAGVSGVYNRNPYEREVRAALSVWERYIGLIIDRDLYAAHKAFLERGDKKAREKADEQFRKAIAEGDGPWDVYLLALVEPKVVTFPQTQQAV